MAVKQLPSAVKIRRIRWRLHQPAQVNRSAYSHSRKVWAMPGGAHWSATVELVPFVDELEAAEWIGFLASLEGPVHSFYLPARDQSGLSYPGRLLTYTLANGKKQMVAQTSPGGAIRPALRGEPVGSPEDAEPFCEVALTEDTIEFLMDVARMSEFPPFEVEEAY